MGRGESGIGNGANFATAARCGGSINAKKPQAPPESESSEPEESPGNNN